MGTGVSGLRDAGGDGEQTVAKRWGRPGRRRAHEEIVASVAEYREAVRAVGGVWATAPDPAIDLVLVLAAREVGERGEIDDEQWMVATAATFRRVLREASRHALPVGAVRDNAATGKVVTVALGHVIDNGLTAGAIERATMPPKPKRRLSPTRSSRR